MISYALYKEKYSRAEERRKRKREIDTHNPGGQVGRESENVDGEEKGSWQRQLLLVQITSLCTEKPLFFLKTFFFFLPYARKKMPQ